MAASDITDEHRVYLVDGDRKQEKGAVFKQHGRWWWERAHGGMDGFHRHYSLKGVQEYIAHLCLVPTNAIKLEKK